MGCQRPIQINTDTNVQKSAGISSWIGKGFGKWGDFCNDTAFPKKEGDMQAMGKGNEPMERQIGTLCGNEQETLLEGGGGSHLAKLANDLKHSNTN